MNFLWQETKHAFKDTLHTFWMLRWVYIATLTFAVGFDGGMLIGWWIDTATK
jgi:hypothetical protein